MYLFLKSGLKILGFLHFYINFRISFSVLTKTKFCSDFYWAATCPCTSMGGIDSILSLRAMNMAYSFISLDLFYFFWQYFVFFSADIFLSFIFIPICFTTLC